VSKVRIQDDLHTLADCFTPVYLLNATVSLLMLSDGTPWRPIIHSEDILSLDPPSRGADGGVA